MKRFDFLICYDISSPSRLQKIAKILEKEAIRIQKSVFFVAEMTKEEIKLLIEKIADYINPKEDDVRIYKVDKHSSKHLRSGVDLTNPNIL